MCSNPGFERAELQEFLDGQGIDIRTVWTGNAARQPMMSEKSFRVPPAACRGNQIREAGVVLPCNHGMGDKHMEFVIAPLQAFLDEDR